MELNKGVRLPSIVYTSEPRAPCLESFIVEENSSECMISRVEDVAAVEASACALRVDRSRSGCLVRCRVRRQVVESKKKVRTTILLWYGRSLGLPTDPHNVGLIL